MKCFCLKDSDIEIKDHKIVMAYDNQLIQQKVEKLINTNLGECFYNAAEGINFKNLMGKNIDEEIVKSEILDALMQIDNSFVITEFEMSTDTAIRKLLIKFKAETSEGEVLEQEVSV